MTGNIRDILLNSETVESLRMEMRISRLFKKYKWPAELGTYYADPETKKLREIDVFCSHIFDKPKKHEGIGAPRILLHVFCECKSLSGMNVIFTKGNPPNVGRGELDHFWAGESADELTSQIAKVFGIEDLAIIRNLYRYVADRAYGENGEGISRKVNFRLPPVDLIAQSFRETKSGKLETNNFNESMRTSPLWNAIRSNLDAVKSSKARMRFVCFDWIIGQNLNFVEPREAIKSIAFFLDVELYLFCYFHPFIVINSPLWHLAEGDLSEIGSARVYIKTIDHQYSYVDIVNTNAADRYIASMIKHLKHEARSSIQKLWRKIESSAWEPGQAEAQLFKIFNVP